MKMSEVRKPGPKAKPGVKSRLIDAGLKVIGAGGYAATGISDISDSASVAKGSFYHYFESKEAFGAAAVDSYFEKHRPYLLSILTDERHEPVERLRRYFQARIEHFREIGFVGGCMLGNLGVEVSDHSDVIRSRLDVQFQQWSDLFTSCIEEGQRRGSISDSLSAISLGRYLVSSWEGAILRTRVEKTDRAFHEFLEFTFGRVLK